MVVVLPNRLKCPATRCTPTIKPHVACRFDMALPGFLHQCCNCMHARGVRRVVCGTGAASQRILLVPPRLLGATLSCAFFDAHVSAAITILLLGLSIDTNEGLVAFRHIFTMLYLTNKIIIISSKIWEHTAYALRSSTISREHTRTPAVQCRYNAGPNLWVGVGVGCLRMEDKQNETIARTRTVTQKWAPAYNVAILVALRRRYTQADLRNTFQTYISYTTLRPPESTVPMQHIIMCGRDVL